jgi:hypothetical protein
MGSNRSPRPQNVGKRHVSPEWESSLTIDRMRLFLYVRKMPPEEPDSDLDWINLGMTVSGFRLSEMTTEELDAFEAFIVKAVERARPICKELDARAAKAWEEGDDSYTRSYRTAPRLVERKRRKS